jgi:hypothetical protein
VLHPTARQPFLLGQFLESERGKFCVYDPQLGWIGKPHAEATFQYLDCAHRVRQNRYGFRGSEHPTERGALPRLAVLGDSFVWGFGVEDDEIFTSVLERRSDPPLEVVNLGVSGYGTDQQLLLWRALGARFRPDVVLLVLCPYTDLAENLLSAAYGHPKPVFRFTEGGHRVGNQPVPERPDAWQSGRIASDAAAAELAQRPLLARLATQSALLSSTLVALARLEEPRRVLERRRILPARDHALSWQTLAHVEPPTSQSAAAWRTLLRLVDLLHDDVVANGARLEILIVPSVIQVYPELWEQFVRSTPPPAGARWSRDAPNERIAAHARAKGIAVIDPLETLRAAGRTNLFLYFPWNSHWTRDGHRLVAEELRRRVPPPAGP